MLSRAEKSYSMFIEEDVEIKVSKELLFPLLQQLNRHLEALSYEQGIIDNFAIQDNINHAEMIMVKLLILMAEPYDRKEIILELNIAEFLVFRECVHLNLQLMGMYNKKYEDLVRQIESIYSMLNKRDIKEYKDYIYNYKVNKAILN
ncbi:conserved protein of unknown function [Tepidanaerobacter acetatoxydans Re1]|uniref:Uncharacterized protein n=1 Tax=Tepidanaerobacter acetatoxydans (strain DSM 21804 / JCM 16047 / Re1) TaxID=1209989 RepID=F4LSN2_TEPAE|nr:hypothetical protein [Tepidanaerobacter acetatoxydans]AEE92422.1 hypothetical protein TepRe1_2307 [Tepidanaerobacter acetatoxydans Re1]CCP27328.1 conserved protein of unknown function [Tepidanaerobacter acetatoxydans Re1]